MPRKSYVEIAAENIEALLLHAQSKLSLDYDDVRFVRNQLLDLFKLQIPATYAPKNLDYQTALDDLVAYAIREKMIAKEDWLLFETKIMGLLTPMPSKVIETFDNLVACQGVESATKWLNEFSENTNYIRRQDIDKNLKWNFEGSKGKIKVTINLSKPEKDPKDVERARKANSGYPKCLLCPENIGFAGDAGHPARQTLRYIPIFLDDEKWFVQYSPFVYFENHVIAFNEQHTPMCFSEKTFKRMLDFVELFPHFFIGSNSPLPIVGGSILAHDHYQGGSKVLPVFTTKPREFYNISGIPEVSASIPTWYNSIIRLSSKNREELLKAVEKVRLAWENYNDESVNILSSTTDEKGNVTPHSTITPICRMEEDEYIFDLILRNNRTDEKHPFGIFHPSEDMHNIKKESIGIIEALGLFILPGRLKSECDEIKMILTGEKPLNLEEISKDDNPLQKHFGMIIQLTTNYGMKNGENKAEKVIVEYINETCERILESTAVFKSTKDGQEAFERFMKIACE